MTRTKKFISTGLILLSFAFFAGALFLYPFGMPDADNYFVEPPERKLQTDEAGQLSSIMWSYFRLTLLGDDFAGWDEEQVDFWKYAIAFSSYGLPSAIIIDPENKDRYRALFDDMIWAMKSRKVWGDFTDRGFGSDPITAQNIMYKGHLNLMYGLFQLSTGDLRYAREYTWLTQQIVDEMRLHHAGIYDGVTCEPNAWFAECNVIGLLSLHIYDKLYDTNYTENEVQWTLDFIMDKMVDPETGLFYSAYVPSHDAVHETIRGYPNSWIMTFMNIFMPEEMAALYPTYRDKLTMEFGPYASIRYQYGQDGHNNTAHIFGLWAAKEFKDKTLYKKLRNTTDKFGKLQVDKIDGGLNYDIPNANALNGVVVATKLHLGWKTVLEHNWEYPTPYDIPDTSNMVWTDLLPTQIYDLNSGRNPLPKDSFDKRPCPSCYWGDYESMRMRALKTQRTDLDTPSQQCEVLEGKNCGLDVLNN